MKHLAIPAAVLSLTLFAAPASAQTPDSSLARIGYALQHEDDVSLHLGFLFALAFGIPGGQDLPFGGEFQFSVAHSGLGGYDPGDFERFPRFNGSGFIPGDSVTVTSIAGGIRRDFAARSWMKPFVVGLAGAEFCCDRTAFLMQAGTGAYFPILKDKLTGFGQLDLQFLFGGGSNWQVYRATGGIAIPLGKK